MNNDQIIKLVNDATFGINSKYPNTISDSQRELIVNHYLHSNKPIELIQQELTDYANKVDKFQNGNKSSYESIKEAYNTINSITKFNKYNLYLDMEITPFLIANKPLNRGYAGLDMLIDLKDIEDFRNKMKNTPYYNEKQDTKNGVKDGNDYGLILDVDDVKVNVSPFIKDKDSITKYKYKGNKFIVEDIKDDNYLKTYRANGVEINSVSLEQIKKDKDSKQDTEVSSVIEEVGYNREEYNQIAPSKIIKEVEANTVNNVSSNEIVKNSLVNFLYDVKMNDNKDIPDSKLNETVERLHNKSYDVIESYLARAKDRLRNKIELPKVLNNQQIENSKSLGYSTTKNMAYTIIFVGIIICLLSVILKVI